MIGNESFQGDYLDTSELDYRYKKKYTGELWGVVRTDVMKEFPFPSIMGLKFYPEVVIWDNMANKYLTRYINDGLRVYYHDQENATTFSKKNTRYKENYYLWLHYINDIWKFKRYEKKQFCKALIGISRDGLLSGKSVREIFQDIHSSSLKFIVFMLLPVSIAFKQRDLKQINS